MHLDDFEKRLKTSNFDFLLGNSCSDENIDQFEKSISKALPKQVKQFYKKFNGFIVYEPKLEIYSLENLKIDKNLNICFGKFNGLHEVAFNTVKLNEALQWNIINTQSKYLITKTMASFWSNKVWAWLEQNRKIWDKEN